MKTRNLLYTLLIFGSLVMISWVLYPTGSPGGKTGSPGDGSNCTECHLGNPAQTATGWITTNIPGAGYVPGMTYTVTATGTHTGVGKFGFEVTSEDASNAKKGTIIVTDAVQNQLVNSNHAITHTVNGTTPTGNSKTWMFDWIAPESGTGAITFYGAFNAANGNGFNTGDTIYLSSHTVMEASNGITDNLASSVDIQIYPNPFTDYIDLEFGNLEQAVKSIRLSGQDGRMVWVKDIQNENPEKYRIDASRFSKGIYFITVVFSDFRQAAYKVVKN